MTGPSIATRIFLKVLENAQGGLVEVTFPDGKVQSYGAGDKRIRVQVRDWDVFDQLFNKGDLGLAEVIIEDRLVVDDAAALVEWACKNDQALGSAFRGKWYGVLADRIRHLLARNTRAGAKENIIKHYDLGNEFYKLWLDPSMTYSSAIYTKPSEELQQAQENKYDRILDQLDIREGDHVLEIGCGWGGFFSRAVERRGCKVTAVMNSPQQYRHNQELVAARKFGNHVELKPIDYRDIEGRYDKIVSIEMIEAVGKQYWDQYFAKVAASSKQGAGVMIQGITIREDLFYSYSTGTDFIQKFVFPGGMLLTDSIFAEKGARNGMHLADSFLFTESYAATLRQWRVNFKKAYAEIARMGFDEKFMRLWEFYLAYCEGAFSAGRIRVGQYLFAA